jgi:hypothetical protein
MYSPTASGTSTISVEGGEAGNSLALSYQEFLQNIKGLLPPHSPPVSAPARERERERTSRTSLRTFPHWPHLGLKPRGWWGREGRGGISWEEGEYVYIILPPLSGIYVCMSAFVKRDTNLLPYNSYPIAIKDTYHSNLCRT